MMKIAILKEDMPLSYKGNFTFYKKGDAFEIVDTKYMPIVGISYKLKGFGIEFEGYIVSSNLIIGDLK